MYKIFTRNWYLADGVTPNHKARKTTITHVSTEEEAREFCHKNNKERPTAWLKRSKKYEYTNQS